MRTHKILRDAKTLLEQDGVWIKGSFANDKEGNLSSDRLSKATTFCAMGACYKASGRDNVAEDLLVEKILNSITEKRADIGITDYNDLSTTTKEDVLSVFDEALARTWWWIV